LNALLADQKKLTAVLTYHVVPGKAVVADVTRLSRIFWLTNSTNCCG